jgi:hypothetical protein
MFIENESKVKYFEIIEIAKSENRKKGGSVYFERHHILPISLGGSNEPLNKVLLTAKEHYKCHQLLVECTSGKYRVKMANALWRMRHGNKGQQKIPMDANEYAILREEYSEIVSLRFRGKKLSEQTKRKMSESKKGAMSADHKMAISKTHKGKTPWNKGLNADTDERLATGDKIAQSKIGKKRAPFSQEWKDKMRKARLGKPGWNKGKTGYKTKPCSEETKRKISESLKRKYANVV